METGGQAPLNEALDQLWKRFLPQMDDRLVALDAANRALLSGKLSDDERASANTAAHKLAGVLGTFGLTKGTVLAREAEMIYSGELEADPAASVRLLQITAELRQLIHNRA